MGTKGAQLPKKYNTQLSVTYLANYSNTYSSLRRLNIYDGAYHTPWGGVPSSIARQPRGCQYRTIRLRKALGEMFLNGKSALGFVIYTAVPVCGSQPVRSPSCDRFVGPRYTKHGHEKRGLANRLERATIKSKNTMF